MAPHRGGNVAEPGKVVGSRRPSARTPCAVAAPLSRSAPSAPELPSSACALERVLRGMRKAAIASSSLRDRPAHSQQDRGRTALRIGEMRDLDDVEDVVRRPVRTAHLERESNELVGKGACRIVDDGPLGRPAPLAARDEAGVIPKPSSIEAPGAIPRRPKPSARANRTRYSRHPELHRSPSEGSASAIRSNFRRMSAVSPLTMAEKGAGTQNVERCERARHRPGQRESRPSRTAGGSISGSRRGSATQHGASARSYVVERRASASCKKRPSIGRTLWNALPSSRSASFISPALIASSRRPRSRLTGLRVLVSTSCAKNSRGPRVIPADRRCLAPRDRAMEDRRVIAGAGAEATIAASAAVPIRAYMFG